MVHLTDGATAREEVTAFDRPSYSAYRVSDFTSSVRHLVAFATAEWWFEDDGLAQNSAGPTPSMTGLLTTVLLQLFVRAQWLGHMRTCIANIERFCGQQQCRFGS